MAHSEKVSTISHMDGSMERWKVQLTEDFFIFIDCNIPLPWSTSDDTGFFGTVLIIGYQIKDDAFLNSN